MHDDDRAIHLVRGGKTLCGILSSALRSMKGKHFWTEVGAVDEHVANCEGCLAERRRRQLLRMGIDLRRIPKI